MQPNLSSDLSDRIRSILETRGLTLSRVSQLSAQLYGRTSHHFVPHTLYHDLRTGSFTPSLQQVCALSRISRYQLMDWFLMFGFELENIPRLQATLPSKRTVIVDSTLNNPNSWMPWIRYRSRDGVIRPLTPMKQLMEHSGHRRVGSVIPKKDGSIYVKVGYADTLAFPEILPGSIVVASNEIEEYLTQAGGSTSDNLFLIEHSKGLSCCRVHFSGKNRIALLSSQLPYAQIELQLPDQARLRGVVRHELRLLTASEHPQVTKELGRPWKPESVAQQGLTLGQQLRASRKRAGLSFREASEKSVTIAKLLKDQQYFASPGALSDYETLSTPPRHIHKVFTLCILYGVSFSAFVSDAAHLADERDLSPIPDNLVSRTDPTESLDGPPNAEEAATTEQMGLLIQLHWPFLRGALGTLTGAGNIKSNDLFWIGDGVDDVSPHLKGGLLAVVNRHKKKALFSTSKATWQQPLFLILKRDGTYVCACCSQEDDMIVIHPCSGELQPPKQLRNRQDAELIGQIAMVWRRLQ